MATEYRELNAVIKAIWSVKISPNAEIFNALKRAIEEEVKNIKPADVVEVMWCRDCKSCNTDSAIDGWYGTCTFWNDHNVMDDDYCSRSRNKDSIDMMEADNE